MSNEKSASEILYGAPKVQPEQPAADASPADILYGPGLSKPNGAYGAALNGGLVRMTDNFGMNENQISEARKGGSNIFRKLDVEPAIAEQMYDRMVEHTINPPSAQTIKDWSVETRSQLRRKYGTNADALLDQTKSYVRANGLSETLERTGLGSHPKTVLELVDRVQRFNANKPK